MSEIESNFGKGSIMRLGATPSVKVETFSTGALTLDLALGGGIPRGRIIEVRPSSPPRLLPPRSPAPRSTAQNRAARPRWRCTPWPPCRLRAARLR
jgi:hypothetical protein